MESSDQVLEPVRVTPPAERPPGPAGPGQVLARLRVVGRPRAGAAGQHRLDPAQRRRDVEQDAVQPLDRLVVAVLQPGQVGIGAGHVLGLVQHRGGLVQARAGADLAGLDRQLGLDPGEFGPAPLVGLGQVDVGAQADPGRHRVPLGPDRVPFGCPRRVVLAQIAGHLPVAAVGLLRGRGELAGQRAVAVGGHQRVVRPGVAVGRGRRLDGLPARRGQAAVEPGVQARPPAGEHRGERGQPGRDVPPALVAVAGQQVDAVPDRAELPDRGAEQPQRLAGPVPGQLGLKPLPQEGGGQPVGLGGHRRGPERGQRRGDQLLARRVAVRPVVGGRAEGLAEPDHPGRDRIQRGPPGDVVVAEPEHLGHAITLRERRMTSG